MPQNGEWRNRSKTLTLVDSGGHLTHLHRKNNETEAQLRATIFLQERGRDSKEARGHPFSRMGRVRRPERRNFVAAKFRALGRIPPSPPKQNPAARWLFY